MQPETTSLIKKALTTSCVAVGLLCFSGLAMAQGNGNGNGNNNGNGNGNISPPIPTIASLAYLVPGTTTDLAIGGTVTSNEAYNATQGSKSISAAFSRAGVTINSITVNSTTSLTLNITVTAGAELGASTLTVTNPNGAAATSTTNIIHVTDVPAITATSLTPSPASVIEDITASATVTNNDTSIAVDLAYLWYEDDVAMSQTNATLPSSVTQQGSSYRCEITPSKLGSIIGATVSTASITVTADKDGNGIHDQWEDDILMEVATDPTLDTDGDGLDNEYEYLFGLDPNDAHSNQAITKPLDPRTGEFEYTRTVKKLDGIVYRVETSPDLIYWTVQMGASQALSNANAVSEVVTVGLPTGLISANPKLFVRVRAE